MTAIDRTRAPRVFTIDAGLAFADTLATGILERHGDRPEDLTRITVLVPNRRAVRALAEAFLRLSAGRATLLPRLRPLGDIDEDELAFDAGFAEALDIDIEPAVSMLERQFNLARLIGRWHARTGREPALIPAEAARMAMHLARLLDQVTSEGLDWAGLDGLAGDFAEHWAETLKFLKIVTEAWPAHLAEHCQIDPADRRNRLIDAQAALWRDRPPDAPVIAAGSTGSLPATARLLAVIARLPHGAVVLPGLDCALANDAWQTLPPGHPQFGLARLLETMQVARAEVAPWQATPVATAVAQRVAAVNRALSDDWSGATPEEPLPGLELIEAPGTREEAAAIAMALREALETPARTAALITPDRALARRVAAELKRWNIEVDDSAGTPLGNTAVGRFLRLAADAVTQGLAPTPLVALLKHPLSAGGETPAQFREQARRLEEIVLRGVRPGLGSAGLTAAARAANIDGALAAWLDRFVALVRPFEVAVSATDAGLAELAAAHVDFAEALAASDRDSGAARLWARDDGEVAANFFSELRAAAPSLGPIEGMAYAPLIAALMTGVTVRPQGPRHPRLAILGTIEARLQSADLVVLSGLNEDTWPAQPAPDPWLSEPMRQAFGLPPAARRIGLSAHDFVQAVGAPRVLLTRAAKVDGTPTVASRWLVRLHALYGDRIANAQRYLDWARALDQAPTSPCPMPAPRPPVEARPTQLSVTQVETWMRDPYALYARHILNLKPLDPLDQDPGASDRGTVVHKILERYLKDAIGGGQDALLAIAREEFARFDDRPAVWGFWWPRFTRVADWFVAEQAARHAAGHRVLLTEKRAEWVVPGTRRPFTLTAKADRIDALGQGGIEIIDYKTGTVPTAKRLEAGFAPQLPLEGVLAEAGAFPNIAAEVAALTFWSLSGGVTAAKIIPVKAHDERIAQARAGLVRLIDAFAKPTTPYLPSPRPEHAGYGDYDHLARVAEWRGPSGGEDSA